MTTTWPSAAVSLQVAASVCFTGLSVCVFLRYPNPHREHAYFLQGRGFFGLGSRPSRSDGRLIRQNYTLTAARDGWNRHRVTQAISWELWRWTGCGGKVLGAVCWSHPAAALSQAESSAFLFSIKLPRDKLSLEETAPPTPTPPLCSIACVTAHRTGRK